MDGTKPGDRGEQPEDHPRLIVPFGGLNQVWGVLMATKSDDPAEMLKIKRQRRLVAALMILSTVVGFAVLLLVYSR